MTSSSATPSTKDAPDHDPAEVVAAQQLRYGLHCPSMRIGVVGLGNMGMAHVRHHVPNAGLELTAVADQDPARREAVPDVARFATGPELAASGLVDAVLVATPHFDHTVTGIAAFEHGLHVLVEKPISVHKADAEQLIKAWGGQTRFGAMFNQRTDSRYQRVREIVKGGTLGPLHRVNWIITTWFRPQAYYDSGGWRATWAGEGGGVLLNQCPHNLDLYAWIFGMPSRVVASGGFGRFHQIEVEDVVTALFEHPEGHTGVFVTSTGELPGTNRLEVVGNGGRLILEGDELRLDLYPEGVDRFNQTATGPFDWKAPETSTERFEGQGGQHGEIVRNFAAACRGEETLLAPGEEGIWSVEMANGAILSMVERRPVDLPLDGARYTEVLRGLTQASASHKPEALGVVADLGGSVR